MKPALFTHHPCRTVAEAVGILGSDPDDSKVLAGGQSLVPMLNLRLANPANLVDLNTIEGLDYIRADNGTLAIGAATRQRTVELDADVLAKLPLLPAALAHVGHSQIRNRGTVAGSICHADPAAEMPAVWLTAGGELTAEGSGGTRTIGSADFFESYLTTALQPDEIVTEVRFTVPTGTTGWHFEEVARRHGDFALLGVAALVSLDGARVRDARVTIFGAGPTPLRISVVEQLLIGMDASEAAGEDVLARAADETSAAVRPVGDVHASADYRRHVAGALVRRAITGSLQSAGAAS
jgi:CO/xanthine dehydrogenase FAD-binding subunit